jgi:integrase family protein
VKLGEYELNELTPLILQRYITELIESGNMKTGKGLAANSVNGIITVIQNSLKLAYALGTIKEYAADKIRRPKTKEKEVTCFTLSEQKKIERAALAGKKTKWLGIVVCLYTGLRIGELLALEWKDVDFQKGVLTVSKSRHEGKDENGRYAQIVESPKTVSSRRCIPLPKQILCELRMLKRKSRSVYVISNGESSIPVRSYQRSFERLLKKLDIPHKGFHALRHTFATRALECGMDVKMLSELLGHKDPAVTLRRYVHSLMEQKKEMMNKVGNTYFKEAK